MAPPRLYQTPSKEQIENSEIKAFIDRVRAKPGLGHIDDFWKLHEWSVQDPEAFWEEIWDWGGILGEKNGKVFDSKPVMSSTGTRLPNATLNYAENVLLSHSRARSSKLALATVVEAPANAKPRTPITLQTLTFEELYKAVADATDALRKLGVGPGDGVASYTPSNGEAIIIMLATSALGGVWSAVAAEAGPKAALERLTQTQPKVLLTADRVRYNGKEIDILAKVDEVVSTLAKDWGLQHVIIVGHLEKSRDPPSSVISSRPKLSSKWYGWNSFLKSGNASGDIKFWRGPALAPLWVLFSSGTTGKPKAIVHHAGGMILAQKMTNRLHHDIGVTDVCLQFTTCGWMMWNVALSMMAMGSSTILYDGSPVATPATLWDMVDTFGCTYLGCSPRYLQIIQAANFHPNKNNSLKTLKTLQVAGAPLSPELYDYVRDSVKANLYLNNASGGTDICGSFVGSSPTLPVYYGEITVPILGMAIDAWSEDGKPDTQGNLVCKKPFPNQPLCFLGDTNDAKYKSTYFDDYPEVWNHSDWIEISPITRGITMLGRSDGVLNPQGVRFGSAELYAVVEEMKDEIEDCLAIGQRNAQQDERVVLFIKPKAGRTLDESMIARLKREIGNQLSKRHIPSKFIACPDIPYTHTLKRVEVAVKKLVNGTALNTINTSAILNPEALEFFIDHPDLRDINAPIKAKL